MIHIVNGLPVTSIYPLQHFALFPAIVVYPLFVKQFVRVTAVVEGI